MFLRCLSPVILTRSLGVHDLINAEQMSKVKSMRQVFRDVVSFQRCVGCFVVKWAQEDTVHSEVLSTVSTVLRVRFVSHFTAFVSAENVTNTSGNFFVSREIGSCCGSLSCYLLHVNNFQPHLYNVEFFRLSF